VVFDARGAQRLRTNKAMADGGARLFIVGFESGGRANPQNIKKGATVEMGRAFMKNAAKSGQGHGDFIIACRRDKETIQKTSSTQGIGLRNDQVSLGMHAGRIARHHGGARLS